MVKPFCRDQSQEPVAHPYREEVELQKRDLREVEQENERLSDKVIDARRMQRDAEAGSGADHAMSELGMIVHLHSSRCTGTT